MSKVFLRLFSLSLSHIEGFLIIMYGCLSDYCASGFIEARRSWQSIRYTPQSLIYWV